MVLRNIHDYNWNLNENVYLFYDHTIYVTLSFVYIDFGKEGYRVGHSFYNRLSFQLKQIYGLFIMFLTNYDVIEKIFTHVTRYVSV